MCVCVGVWVCVCAYVCVGVCVCVCTCVCVCGGGGGGGWESVCEGMCNMEAEIASQQKGLKPCKSLIHLKVLR